MPVLFPGNVNQLGGQISTAGTASVAAGTAGAAVSLADPVYAVPYAFWNVNGSFAVTASGGAASASVTVDILPAFMSASNASVWTALTATANHPRIRVTFTVNNAATATASASGFGGGATYPNLFPLAPFGQLIASVVPSASITATVTQDGLMHWRR